MNTGDKITLGYKVNIPENLKFNQQAYENYTVYFDNVTEERTIQDKQVATKVGLTTGQGPELEVSIETDVGEQNSIQAGKLLGYTVKVKNVGKEALNNVTVTGTIPEGTIYTYYDEENSEEFLLDENAKEHSENFEEIGVGETVEMYYLVKVKNIANGGESAEITAGAYSVVSGVDAKFQASEIKTTVIRGTINTNLTISPIPETYPKVEDEEFTYELEYENVASEPIYNIVIEDTLPVGIVFIQSSKGGTYDENTRTVTFKNSYLEEGDIEDVFIKVKVDKLDENNYNKEIANKMKISGVKEVSNTAFSIESNEVAFQINKPHVSIKQESNARNTLLEGDEVTYDITIKNDGSGEVEDVRITDYLPDALKFEGASYVLSDGTEIESNVYAGEALIRIPMLEAGEEIKAYVKATVKELGAEENEKEITNKVSVSFRDLEEEIYANEITNKIVKSGKTEDPTVSQIVEGTYYISGHAWLDSNGNGGEDENEKRLTGINVMLVDSNTGNVVRDSVSGEEKKQKLSDEGEYTFANVSAGNYIVVFEYDNTTYAITTYQKEGIAESINSDVNNVKMEVDGELKQVGATDTLKIENGNKNNINIGLIENAKFDLKLEKEVTKITLVDKNGTKESTPSNKKFAKLDIPDKTINGANVIIEYKLKITNEGELGGYAKKIVDYLPTDMKFASNLNKDWYQSNDGNLYNTSLSSMVIMPGETKELTLVLTKTMTGSTTGPIHNTAEIYEATTTSGFSDVDSTPGNEAQAEDDFSSADVLIGIKTGQIYIYILLISLSIGIFGVGIYFIKKKVLTNENK